MKIFEFISALLYTINMLVALFYSISMFFILIEESTRCCVNENLVYQVFSYWLIFSMMFIFLLIIEVRYISMKIKKNKVATS